VFFVPHGGSLVGFYGRDGLADMVDVSPEGSGFSGVVFNYVVRSEDRVGEVLDEAKKAGGKILKPAAKLPWGGYGGSFADPDGYMAWLVSSMLRCNCAASRAAGVFDQVLVPGHRGTYELGDLQAVLRVIPCRAGDRQDAGEREPGAVAVGRDQVIHQAVRRVELTGERPALISAAACRKARSSRGNRRYPDSEAVGRLASR
jgi:hypothetical protein